MFIYLKSSNTRSKNRYIINKIEEGDCRYFEIVFSGNARARLVKRAVKHCPKGLSLVSDGVALPRELRHRRADTSAFDRLLLANTFCELITGQRRAIVSDPQGILAEQLLRPLTRVGSLYVITARQDIYEEFGRQALQQVGTSPIILDSADGIDAPVTLSAGGLARSRITLGEGGYLPCGERVFIRGKLQSRALCAAKYLYSKKELRALPERLENGSLSATVNQLKSMLDTTCSPLYN